ncbi:MAG: CoA-binding protein [Chloroflexi bacterium]|nr:CoA-binding protein [Chloroflexota bacterium]
MNSQPRPQEALIRDFVEQRVWAVVGVSEDPRKFGHIIFLNLRAAGYQVYGVNPKGGCADGESLYPCLAALPEPPAVVDLVVPPPAATQVVQEMHRLGLHRAWLQPGAESDEAIAFCHAHGIDVIHGACAMVHRRKWR